MLHLNSNTIVFAIGNNQHVIKFASNLEDLVQQTKRLIDSLTNPENLKNLDTDVASPYTITLFANQQKQKLDQIEKQLEPTLEQFKKQIIDIYNEVELYTRDMYSYNDLTGETYSISDIELPTEKSYVV